MNKYALRFLVASALLSPATLYALGLGEIRLNSALNQPFDADIEVVSATADELTGLNVTLASEETFRRYGLDRPNFLSGFSLHVDGSNPSRPVIKVRSSSAVSEPFLNLLVEVSWSGGKALREYTVLLDPPVLSPAATSTQPIQAPRAGAAVTNSAPSGSIVRAAPAAPAAPVPNSAPAANTAGNTTYTVKSADTLSRIASTMNRDGKVNVKQTMVAIYRANPDAFAGNMNVLRSGSVLRIPAAADIAAISSAEASSEISRQTGSWRNVPAANIPAAPASAPAPVAEKPASERLRLVPADQSGTAAAQSNTANEAANGRIKTLEAELAETKRLLDLKNAELARMQQQLAPGQPAGMAAESEAVPDTASSSASSLSESSSSSATVEPAPQAAPSAAVEKVQAQPAAGTDWLSQLSAYALWLILGAVGLIMALLLFLRRRQQMQASDSATDTFIARDFEEHLSRRNSQLKEQSADDATDDQAQHQALSDPTFEMAAPDSMANTLSDDTLSGETAFHVDQQDALGEADFHMAYGLYDQAADIVKLAIERQPERRDLKIKLAEIYFVWGNKDAFTEVARGLHDSQDQAAPGEWDKVLIMGKQICSDDPLFSGDLAGSHSADSVDVNLEGGENHIDVDLFDAPEGGSPSAGLDDGLASTAEMPKGNEPGLDFLLDEPQRGVEADTVSDLDSNARTQETPTIESPYLPEQGSATVSEKLDQALFELDESSADRTAELSLDEIGLDVGSLDAGNDDLDDEQQIQDDELTRIAAVDQDNDLSETKNLFAAQMDALGDDEEPTGNTISIEAMEMESGDELLNADQDGTGIYGGTQKIEVDFELDPGTDDTAEQLRPDISSTGLFKSEGKLDVDLDRMADPEGFGNIEETAKQTGRSRSAVDDFSDEVFSSAADDDIATPESTSRNEVLNTEFDMNNIEPATMSEVGTKLDLARAYMDMGDPDGARSILQEVLEEGTPGQKQEAQRLLSSIG